MLLRNRITIAVLFILAVTCGDGPADDARPKAPVTLLGMLSEWQYPGSKFNGAESSDAGVEGIFSVKCKAVLTTPDSADKVVAYYQQQLNVDSSGKALGQNKEDQLPKKRTVSIQDSTAGRPLKLYIICINEKTSSTTLVISRAEAEELTHIAWSNFRHLEP